MSPQGLTSRSTQRRGPQCSVSSGSTACNGCMTLGCQQEPRKPTTTPLPCMRATPRPRTTSVFCPHSLAGQAPGLSLYESSFPGAEAAVALAGRPLEEPFAHKDCALQLKRDAVGVRCRRDSRHTSIEGCSRHVQRGTSKRPHALIRSLKQCALFEKLAKPSRGWQVGSVFPEPGTSHMLQKQSPQNCFGPLAFRREECRLATSAKAPRATFPRTAARVKLFPPKHAIHMRSPQTSSGRASV